MWWAWCWMFVGWYGYDMYGCFSSETGRPQRSTIRFSEYGHWVVWPAELCVLAREKWWYMMESVQCVVLKFPTQFPTISPLAGVDVEAEGNFARLAQTSTWQAPVPHGIRKSWLDPNWINLVGLRALGWEQGGNWNGGWSGGGGKGLGVLGVVHLEDWNGSKMKKQ